MISPGFPGLLIPLLTGAIWRSGEQGNLAECPLSCWTIGLGDVFEPAHPPTSYFANRL
jgi:hypothetical protein